MEMQTQAFGGVGQSDIDDLDGCKELCLAQVIM